jgi:hypothetical protein
MTHLQYILIQNLSDDLYMLDPYSCLHSGLTTFQLLLLKIQLGYQIH